MSQSPHYSNLYPTKRWLFTNINHHNCRIINEYTMSLNAPLQRHYSKEKGICLDFRKTFNYVTELISVHSNQKILQEWSRQTHTSLLNSSKASTLISCSKKTFTATSCTHQKQSANVIPTTGKDQDYLKITKIIKFNSSSSIQPAYSLIPKNYREEIIG